MLCQYRKWSYRHVIEVKLCLLMELLLLNAPERAIHRGLSHHGLSFVGLVDDPLHGAALSHHLTHTNYHCGNK